MMQVHGRPEDTYLQPDGFTKGVMWVNGHNLGRYWEAQGPQRSFFAPAPFLREGINVVVLLELEPGDRDCMISSVAELIYREPNALVEAARLKEQRKFKDDLLEKLQKLKDAHLRKTHITQSKRLFSKNALNANNGHLQLASLPLHLRICAYMLGACEQILMLSVSTATFFFC